MTTACSLHIVLTINNVCPNEGLMTNDVAESQESDKELEYRIIDVNKDSKYQSRNVVMMMLKRIGNDKF